MRNRSVLRAVTSIKNDHAKPIFPVDGFDFVLDDPDHDTLTVEQCKAHNFNEEGMPNVQGFIYVSDEYKQYLKAKDEILLCK